MVEGLKIREPLKTFLGTMRGNCFGLQMTSKQVAKAKYLTDEQQSKEMKDFTRNLFSGM